jgi:magnesium transporter
MSFGQRPKLEAYDHYVFLVVFGAVHDEDDLVEVHCFYSTDFLVTVRRDSSPAFAAARERASRRPERDIDPARALYRVIDGLVDSFFPILSDLDDLIDAVERGVLERPSEEQVRRIFQAKRRLTALRRVIVPERDVIAGVANGVAELPGVDLEHERLFRDVYDHLIRLVDALDSYRDLLTSLMDLYLSRVSNRLGSVMKQLTLIATIFLPLTFITGFFGQNFGWLVDHVAGLPSFLWLGLGTQLVTFGILFVYFRRRGWFEREPGDTSVRPRVRPRTRKAEDAR